MIDNNNNKKESTVVSDNMSKSPPSSEVSCFFGAVDLGALPLDNHKKPSKEVKFFNCNFRKYPTVRKRFSFL